jgi:hypothetical protein
MPEDFQELVTSILEEGRREFEIEIQIEEYNRGIAVDVSALVLNKVLFCGWMAQLLSDYADYLNGTFREKDIPENAIKFLDTEIVPLVLANQWSWIDCYEHPSQFFWKFRHLYADSVSGAGVAFRSELLRIEIVEMYMVNPSLWKIIVSGATAAMIFLASAFGAVHVTKELGAQECRAAHNELLVKQTDRLFAQSKLEGHFTNIHEEALAKINAAHSANIAVCGSAWSSVNLETNKGGVKVSANADDLRNEKLPE